MTISPTQLASFRSTGSLLFPGLIPSDLVETAKREAPAANWGPGVEPQKITLDALPPVMAQMMALVQPHADEILGEVAHFNHGMWSVHATGGGFGGPAGWHLDGFGTLARGGTWDQVPGFKLLVGVFLTDLSVPRRGNLMLAEGGHLAVARWMRDHSAKFTDSSGKVRDNKEFIKALRADANIPERVPLLAHPGDVVLVHSMVPHTVDTNEGPPRPAIYFRLGRSDYGGLEKLKNPW